MGRLRVPSTVLRLRAKSWVSTPARPDCDNFGRLEWSQQASRGCWQFRPIGAVRWTQMICWCILLIVIHVLRSLSEAHQWERLDQPVLLLAPHLLCASCSSLLLFSRSLKSLYICRVRVLPGGQMANIIVIKLKGWPILYSHFPGQQPS